MDGTLTPQEHRSAYNWIEHTSYEGIWFQEDNGSWCVHKVFPVSDDHFSIAVAAGIHTHEELLNLLIESSIDERGFGFF